LTKNHLPPNREETHYRKINGLDLCIISVVVVMGIIFLLLCLLMYLVG